MAIAVKEQAKVDVKLFLSYPVLLDFSILFQLLCPGLQFFALALFHGLNDISDQYLHRPLLLFILLLLLSLLLLLIL